PAHGRRITLARPEPPASARPERRGAGRRRAGGGGGGTAARGGGGLRRLGGTVLIGAAAEAPGAGEGPFTRSRIELSCGRSMDRARLVTMKSPARTVVARESTFAEPRGPKAVWVAPP